MISTSAPRRVVKLVARAPQGGISKNASTSPQHYDQPPCCTTATDEAAGTAELSRKRKADCSAGDTMEPEAKKGKTLYETTIAAPFRRARRSLVCMHKVFQPIWSRATAQNSAAVPHNSTEMADDATLLSLDPVAGLDPMAAEAAVAAAQTPQKRHLLRAASPLLEEMLESPVTASKPAPEAASGSPGRHALYQDAPVSSSSSSHQQGLPFPLPCAMLPGDGNNAISTEGLAVLGTAAGSDRCRQGVPHTLDKDAAPQCSMSGNATDPIGVAAAIGTDTCLSRSPVAKLQNSAVKVSSKSGSEGSASVGVGHNVTDVADNGAAACCCSDTATCTPSASVSLGSLLSTAQAVTGADGAVDPSRGCLEAVGQDTAGQQVAQQQPGSGSGAQVIAALGASHIQLVTAALPLPTPSSRRVSFSLPEGANCKDPDRTPGKGFMRSPRKASPNKPYPFRYSPGKAGIPRFRSDLSHGYVTQPHAWSPLGRHMHPAPPQFRPTPTKCCSSFGSQQAKRVASTGGHDSEHQRGGAAGGDVGCEGRVVDESEEGCGRVSGQEVGAGYVDIPRRVAWERLGSGRRNQALQATSQQIDPLQQDCRAAFLNEKLVFSWKAGQAWAQLDLAGIHFTQDTCSQHHTEWKAAAERLIEKRGYLAAEQFRTTLQAEWQQLKAIRKRCYTSLPEVSDGAGHSNLLPRTPKSIMKRKSPFQPSSDAGAGMLTSALCT